MNKLASKKIVTRILVTIFLCTLVLFLSAFTYPKESKYLTRLEMAILIEKILDDDSTNLNLDSSNDSIFSDLNKNQLASISKVVNYQIMSGFSDNTFRPNEPMHNLEVISYLQRLTEFLRSNNPECYSAKQLFRFLSYSEDPTIAFEYNPINFPKGFEQPDDLTPKSFAIELSNKLLNKNTSTNLVFSGKIIDSITNKPVTNAYIAINKQAMAVENNGNFTVNFSKDIETANIFAVAEGYQPIEIRKDLNLSRNITIRLKPEQ